MAKISETFGYGERINKKESPPLKKPNTTEPRQNRKKVVQKPLKPIEPVEPTPKPKAKGVKKWEFDSNSLPAKPSRNRKNLDIDPELDGMLAQLETDEDFMKLSDNEQIAWLESLFFLDTPSKGKCLRFPHLYHTVPCSHLFKFVEMRYQIRFRICIF